MSDPGRPLRSVAKVALFTTALALLSATLLEVALGDSQTYGTGVRPEDAWPRQLEAIMGQSWYGMGFGGYGPPHSLLISDEAMAAGLQPYPVGPDGHPNAIG